MSLFDDLYGSTSEPTGLEADLYGVEEESEEDILAKRRKRLAELKAAGPLPEPPSTLGAIGGAIGETFLKDVPATLVRGAALGGSNIVEGAAGLAEMVGEAVPGGEGYAEKAREQRRLQQMYQKDVLGTGELAGGERIATNIAAQLPQLGGIAAFGPAKGVAALGAVTGGQEYGAARDTGASQGKAIASAVISGGSEALFERYLGDVPLLKRIMATSGGLIETPKQALRYLVKQGGGEGAEEALTFVSQRIGQESTYLDSYDQDAGLQFKTDMQGLLESTAMGLGLGVGLGRVSMGARMPSERATLPQEGRSPSGPMDVLPPTLPKAGEVLAEAQAAKDGAVADLVASGPDATLGLDAAIADTELRIKRLTNEEATKPAPEVTPQVAPPVAPEVAAPTVARPEDIDLDETLPDLRVEEWEGRVGDRRHITRKETGTIPTAALAGLLGVKGESPGQHGARRRAGKDWENFLTSVKERGITDPILVIVEPGSAPRISEGNTRRDAALELGLRNVPVEIRYFGHAEKEGTVSGRSSGRAAPRPSSGETLDETLPDPVLSAEMVERGTARVDRTVQDLYDANAAQAIQQSDAAEVEAVLSGDPGSLGGPEQYARERVKLEARLLDLKGERDKLRYGVQEAGKTLSFAVQTPAEARAAVKAIREHALSNAIETRDPDVFDRADEETRRRLDLYPQDLDETMDVGAALTHRTPGEAASALRDVMVSALPQVEAKANREYDKALKVGEIDGTVDKAAFVQSAIVTFQTAMNTKFRAIMEQAGVKAPSEMLNEMDAVTRKLAKDFDINLKTLGYRGNAALDYSGIVDKGADWLRARVPEGDLTRVSESDARALVEQARTERAPVAVFDFLANEMKRRVEGKPPRRPRIGQGNPDAYLQKVAEGIPEDINRALFGPKQFDAPTNTTELRASKARKAWGRLLGQFDSTGQLSHGKVIAHRGVSIRDAAAQLVKSSDRQLLAKKSLDALNQSETDKAAMHYEISSTLAAFEARVAAYITEANKQGYFVNADEIQKVLYDAYTSGSMAQLPQPLQAAVTETLQPLLDKYTRLALDNITDPDERAQWKEQMGRHLYRAYAIFHDPDVAAKPLTRGPAYERFFAKQKARSWEKLWNEAYKENIGKLKDAGLSEADAQDVISRSVEDRLHAQIESIVKQHISSDSRQTRVTSLLRKAQEVYREERVLDDPDLRAIMGEERHMTLAAQIGLGEIASDVAAFKKQKSLMALYTSMGLLGTTEAPGRTVRMNSETLEAVKADDPNVKALWATPEVHSILEGVKVTQRSLDYALNRVISVIKLGYVLNPGSWLQNMWSVPQSLLIAGGPTGMWNFVRPKSLAEARLIAKEFANPGEVSAVADVDRREILAGYQLGEKDFREGIQILTELGLAQGGEWYVEYEKGAQAALEGFKAKKRGKTERLVHAGAAWYSRPDVIAKVLAYRMHLSEAMWKEGVETATPDMKRVAAQKALNNTQNPRTTPQAIRNMSRGVLGVFAFNFAGFAYQMNRNLYYGIQYIVEDAVHAKTLLAQAAKSPSKVEQANLRTKAGRYGKAALNRTIGTAISFGLAGAAYGALIKGIAGAFDDEDDERDPQEFEAHIRHFRPFPEQRRQRTKVLSAPWRGKDGNIYSTIAETGRLDVFDQTRQMLAALVSAVPGTTMGANAPTKTLAPHERALEAVNIFRQQYAELSGAGEAILRFVKIKKQDGEMRIEMSDPIGAAKGIMPSALRSVQDAATGLAAAAENPEVGVEDEGFAKAKRVFLRNTTGVNVRTVNHNDDIASTYRSTWGGATFIQPMREAWKGAKTADARIKVKRQYASEWDKLMRSFADHSEHAKGLGFKAGELRKIMEEDTRIPSYLRKKLSVGVPVSLDKYLSEIELE